MAYGICLTIQFIGVIVAFLTIICIIGKSSSDNQKAITLSSICGFISILAYLLEISSTTLSEAFLAVRVGYVGKCYSLLFFLIFTARYCNVRINKRIISSMFVLNTFILVLVLTSKYHKFYYTSYKLEEEGLFTHVLLGKGLFYYIFIGMTFATIVAFLTIAIKAYFRENGQERKKIFLIVLAGLIPAFALLLYYVPILKGYDTTPLGIVIAGALIAYNVNKFGLLDVVEMAKDNIVDYTKDAVIVVNQEIELLYANSKANQLFPGIEKTTLEASNTIREIFNGVQHCRILEHYEEMTKLFNIDGRIYEAFYSPIYNRKKGKIKNIRGYFLWLFDKTNSIKQNNELIRLKEEAENANLAKTSFLASMSHEIRTPMNAIVGFTDLILNNDIDFQTHLYASYIKQSGTTLLHIINDILDISKIESGKMEIVEYVYDSKALYTDVIIMFDRLVNDKGLEFIVNISNDLPAQLYGDGIKIKEVFINLLNNALKYTKHGNVTFTVEVEKFDDIADLKISVKDTGIGIKEEDKYKVFNEFEQVDNLKNYSVEGTGLGLAITKKLLELMGGEIFLSSVYGEGTEFIVCLRQKIIDKKPIGEINQNNLVNYNFLIGGFEIKNCKVLVVDDNVVNLQVAKGIMSKYGIIVDIVDSGRKALPMLKHNSYNMIFLDQMMPDLDGIKTLKLIKESGFGYIPTILLTANVIRGVKEDMIDRGFDDFLSKPIDISRLERIFKKFLLPENIIYKENDTTDNRRNSFPVDSFVDVRISNDENKDLVSKALEFEVLNSNNINHEKGIFNCGSKELYLDILKMVTELSQERINKIQNFINSKDIIGYTIEVHSLKSSLANIGADDVSALARELEKAGNEGDENKIYDKTPELIEEYKKVIAAIEKQLENSHKDNIIENNKSDSVAMDIGNETIEFDYIELLIALTEAKDYLEELDDESAKATIINIIDRTKDEIKSLLEKIIKSIDGFDFEQAKELISKVQNLNDI